MDIEAIKKVLAEAGKTFTNLGKQLNSKKSDTDGTPAVQDVVNFATSAQPTQWGTNLADWVMGTAQNTSAGARSAIDNSNQAINDYLRRSGSAATNVWNASGIPQFFNSIGQGISNAWSKANGQQTNVEVPNTGVTETTEASTEETNGTTEEAETVTYTYKPGDNFGQVILDLGLMTDNGLWGTNGDVAYYTQQLVDQGVLDSNGNIPVGTMIKLQRRK